jgi:hypothetical protein
MALRDKPLGYDALVVSLEAAGFVTTYMGFENDEAEEGHPIAAVRLIMASERVGEVGVSGPSFWVLRGCSSWVLGTWGAAVYEVPSELIEPLVIAWMRRLVMSPKSKTGTTLDADLMAEFAVCELNAEDFEVVLAESTYGVE